MPRTKKSNAKGVKAKKTAKRSAKRTTSIPRSYELTVVVSPEVKAEKRKEVVSSVKKLVTTLKGSVNKVDEWGLKDLAYPVAKQLTGWYAFFELEMLSKTPAKLEEKLQRDEKIIRYLLVKIG
jgi:small subunit ribosomal protein S6